MGKEMEYLELWARRRLEVEIEPSELERLERRLEALKAALGGIEHLLPESSEPLTAVALEDE